MSTGHDDSIGKILFKHRFAYGNVFGDVNMTMITQKVCARIVKLRKQEFVLSVFKHILLKASINKLAKETFMAT